MQSNPTPFSSVTDFIGCKPPDPSASQNVKRAYSELFSLDVAEWVAGYIQNDSRLYKLLSPEAPVPTVYGEKRLDVGGQDRDGYLALDVSIKTFNSKDGRSGKYTKNKTGRCYELMGESLDLRSTYPQAVLVALIFLPLDGCHDHTEKAASSFSDQVKQFSKVVQPATGWHMFDFVFMGLHNREGEIFFFDTRNTPPERGRPADAWRLSTEDMLERFMHTVRDREADRCIDEVSF